MRNKLKTIICMVFLLTIFSSNTCSAFWVWSSETKKWVNPVYQVFDTPQEQFDWAMGYFEEKDYKKAMFEFRKILKKFPKSEYAPEAKFYIAGCLENLNKWYPAFKEYQSIIDIYPMNKRLEEIVENQYLLGEKFFDRRKYYHAQDIFKKVLANAPYSQVSDVVKYKIGLASLRMKEYHDARDEFEELIDSYGFSPYVDDASFNVGLCSYKLSSSVKDYDEELIDRAITDLKHFARRYETSKHVGEAESLLNKLVHKKAEKLYSIAQFYQKQRKVSAAKKYYEELIFTYPKTDWAEKANIQLKTIEKNG